MKKVALFLVLVGVLAGCSSTYSAGLSHYVVPTQPVVVRETIIEEGFTSYRFGPPPVYVAPQPVVIVRPQPYYQYWGNNQYYRPNYRSQYNGWSGLVRERNRHEEVMTREENRRQDQIRDDIRHGLNDLQRARQSAQQNNGYRATVQTQSHQYRQPVPQSRDRVVNVTRGRDGGRQVEPRHHVRQMSDGGRRRN